MSVAISGIQNALRMAPRLETMDQIKLLLTELTERADKARDALTTIQFYASKI